MASRICSLPDGREPRFLAAKRVKIRLYLAEPLYPGFLHGAGIRQLLTCLWGDPPPAGIFPSCLESGHVRYAEGEAYDLVLTAVGEERRRFDGLEKILAAAGRQKNRPGPRLGKPGVCFEVAGVEELPLPGPAELEAKAARLAAGGRELKIRFLSPLRQGQPGFCGELAQRYRDLRGCAAGLPPLPPAAKVRAEKLVRVDLPLDPRTQLRQAHPAPTVISGQVGTLIAENLPAEWLLVLALLEDFHVGKAIDYGFGAYTTGEPPIWHRPAMRYEEGLWPEEISPERAAEVLCPAANALLDEGAASYSRGLSRATAGGGLQRAREEGLNGPVGGVAERFVAGLAESRILARLEALWPGEPLLARFPAWLANPEAKAKLTRLIAKIFAVELADELSSEGRRLVRVGGELRALGRQAARVA